ncbi:hypothetical protein BKA56DRAFT_589757 [Ilyonectria sp. MPI-CAGE-AT-0026]|nr:hypothetical protein BKA56DRAFT_589757 [Ilyonectria sp. MPI-CAGE-AT-0026]
MQSKVTQKRQRPGRSGNSSSSVEQRRARNRESQKSFRERRTQRMQELEEQVLYLSMGQDEGNARLVSENRALRDIVMQTKHQASRIGLLLKELNDSLAGCTTDKDSSASHQDPDKDNGGDSVPSCPTLTLESSDPGAAHDSDSPDFFPDATQFASIADANASGATEGHFGGDYDPSSLQTDICFQVATPDPSDHIIPTLLIEDLGKLISASANLPQPSPPQPSQVSTNLMSRHSNQGDEQNEFSFNETPGDFSELDMSLSSQHCQQQLGMHPIMQPKPPGLTADSLSGCIDLMEFSIQSVLCKFIGKPHEAFVNKACLGLMLFFIRHFWPGPTVMWFGSFCYAMAEGVLASRINPSQHSTEPLPSYMKPTELQLTVSHPAMIGWINIAELRDRIIANYTSGPSIDELWLDLMASAVVEVEDVSTIITGAEPGPGFFGVWNIFESMENRSQPPRYDFLTADLSEDSPELSKVDSLGLLRVYRMPLPDFNKSASSSTQRQGHWTPVSLQQLFSSPQLARKLYYHLELYNSHKNWRINPSFFDKYLNLKWDGYNQYTASGTGYYIKPAFSNTPSIQTLDKVITYFQSALIRMIF